MTNNESVHATTLRELGFSAMVCEIVLEDGPLGKCQVYHVPGQEVTYTADDTGACWIGEGHINIAHVYAI